MEKKPRLICSTRLIFTFLMFFCNMINFLNITNISVGIICMVTKKSQYRNVSMDILANSSTTDFTETRTYFGLKDSFDWPKKIQGFILSAVFVGAFCSQLFAGWLAFRIGAKRIILTALIVQSILSILTPFSANYDYKLLIFVRFFVGVCRGSILSSNHVILSNWAPPAERSTISSISSSGSLFGNISAFLFGGLLCMDGLFGGWPAMFFLTGIIGLIWCILWAVLITDSPHDNRFISDEEKSYILDKTKEFAAKNSQKKKSVPWIKIVSSKPVIGLVITTFCASFGLSLNTTSMPIFLNDILKFNIKSNGEFSAFAYFLCWILVIISGILCDYIISSKKLSRTHARKLFNSLGFIVPIICYIGLIFVTYKTRWIGFVLYVLNVSFGGIRLGAGFYINFVEIGGSYAGIIHGLANTFSGMNAILPPILMGFLTQNKAHAGWIYLFIIASTIFTVGFLSFLLLGKCEIQEWAKTSSSSLRSSKDIDFEDKQPLKA